MLVSNVAAVLAEEYSLSDEFIHFIMYSEIYVILGSKNILQK